jgi:hypothetical protein
MTTRTIATGIAVARAAIGVGVIVAPHRVAKNWVGETGTGVRVIGAALGARDVAVALGTLNALHRDEGVKPWLAASALCDAADAAATFTHRDELPKAGAIGVTALAAAGAALGAYVLAR